MRRAILGFPTAWIAGADLPLFLCLAGNTHPRRQLEAREEALQPVLLVELVFDVLASGLIALVAYRRGGWPPVVGSFIVLMPVVYLTAVALPRTWALHNLERAIGVIYRPSTERMSHYFHAALPRQFDEWLFFDRTRAVTALESLDEEEGEVTLDTYPFAV